MGELTNLNNVVSSGDHLNSEVDPQKHNCIIKSKKIKKEVPITTTATAPATTSASASAVKDNEKLDLETTLDDPQFCVPYVSDVYAYLYEMEVNEGFCVDNV